MTDNAVCLSVCVLSVRPSSRLSVTLCIVAKRYILQQKYPNKWIGSAVLETRFYNFQPLITPEPFKLSAPESRSDASKQKLEGIRSNNNNNNNTFVERHSAVASEAQTSLNL